MSRRALIVALFASLALNLFVIGAVIGGLVVGQHLRAERPAAQGRQPLMQAADALSPDHRRAYRHMLRSQALPVGVELRQARMARVQAWSRLAEDPVAADGIKQELDAARTREMAARSSVEHRIVDFAAALSAAERAQLAQGLTRSGPQGRGQRERAHPPAPMPEGTPR